MVYWFLLVFHAKYEASFPCSYRETDLSAETWTFFFPKCSEP